MVADLMRGPEIDLMVVRPATQHQNTTRTRKLENCSSHLYASPARDKIQTYSWSQVSRRHIHQPFSLQAEKRIQWLKKTRRWSSRQHQSSLTECYARKRATVETKVIAVFQQQPHHSPIYVQRSEYRRETTSKEVLLGHCFDFSTDWIYNRHYPVGYPDDLLPQRNLISPRDEYYQRRDGKIKNR